MKGFIPILILGILNSSFSASQNPQERKNGPPAQVKILKQINKVNDDGSYTFGYEADDGSFKVETRSKDGVVKGKYGFIDPSGKLKTVEYSAGKRALTSSELGASATETEPQAVKAKVRESRENSAASDERSSKEVNNESGRTSSESSTEEDDPAFNSFSNPPQPGQKDGGEVSELTKRQGQLGTGAQYAGQGQRFQGTQPYIPTTQLQGGQFADPRGQGGAGFSGIPQRGPQFYQPGGQPQYLVGGPQQFPTGGIGGPQSHYVGRQYPQQQYIGGSPQFGGGFPLTPQRQQQGQDEEGFVAGLPPNFYAGAQQPRQQFAYNPQSAQGLGGGFVRPGFQQSPYQQQQFISDEQGLGQQVGRPQFNRFPSSGLNSGNPQTFNQGQGQQQYVPNAELDGFSEDSDQDGFVDAYPGTEGSKEEAADEKTPAVKSPGGERIQGQYSPQVLGPQQVLQGQGRPGFGSPYNEQGLQQIYPQQQGLGLGRPQNAYPQQFNQFAFQGQQPQQFQSPYLQQYSPQFGGPQTLGGGGGPYIPGQGQLNGLSYGQGQAYPGGPQFSQFPVGGQQQFLQGQPQYAQSGQPQYVNIQGNVSPGAQQFPYDYVGGVGPNGFPLGGPQTQFPQQPQRQELGQQGPSPGPPASATPGPSGSVQAAASESKKDSSK